MSVEIVPRRAGLGRASECESTLIEDRAEEEEAECRKSLERRADRVWRSSTPDAKPRDQLGDLAKRDIPCELRERYWIRNAEGAGIKGGIGISIGVPWWIERHELEQK